MDGNTAIANILKMEGTEYLFCFPANTLIEAAAVAGIKPIMSRTERTTVNMADGYTRMTNGHRTGVLVSRAPVSKTLLPALPTLMPSPRPYWPYQAAPPAGDWDNRPISMPCRPTGE